MPPRLCSIVLAAHGSTATENCNDPLHELAAAILQRQEKQSCFSPKLWIENITPAFLQGEPQMTQVLESLPQGDVIVIPVMTSEGYYLRKLPEKFASNKNAEHFNFYLSSVFGMHAMIADEMKSLVANHLARFHLNPADTTVVVVGHGTRRNKTSGESTYRLTNTLAEHFPQLNCRTGFLDQDPDADRIASEITTPHTIILPFLISRGPHTTEDVPQAFGLPTGCDLAFPYIQKSDSGIQIYEKPLAMYSTAVDICIALANETLASNQPVKLIRKGELSL
ncbi:MAG: CbiX/SirB N-terminal domain-containing protein [Mariniblastus sp.]